MRDVLHKSFSNTRDFWKEKVFMQFTRERATENVDLAFNTVKQRQMPVTNGVSASLQWFVFTWLLLTCRIWT